MNSHLESIKRMVGGEVSLRWHKGFASVRQQSDSLVAFSLQLKPRKIIWPLREGELITEPGKIPIGEEYSLSYPGTASTKCVVVYQDDINVFIGGQPSYQFTKIILKRLDQTSFQLTFLSPEHDFMIIPFAERWEEAAASYRRSVGSDAPSTKTHPPKYMLQLGVRDGSGKTYINHFDELTKVLNRFHEHFGPGHIVHFFGTNQHGFDRMFPDFTIDPKLGGKQALTNLVAQAKRLQLLTSHHYIPRIADMDWLEQNPEYREAIVSKDGREVIEHYNIEGNGGRSYYVMDPNNELWYKKCLQSIEYLSSIGFDYIEIDQIAYQRNFYHPTMPLAHGYQRLINELIKRDIAFWVEGVSDIFRLPPGNFYQILIRNRCHLWEDKENRRGYAYGESYPDFFLQLWPQSEVSYQIFTENKAFDTVGTRAQTAARINATIHDIELGFHDESYLPNLDRLKQTLGRTPCHILGRSPSFTIGSDAQTVSP